MDRKIKERLIGLVVLLTLAVIFLPMFLGGPEESGERRRVPLATETREDLPETRLNLNDDGPASADQSGDNSGSPQGAGRQGSGDNGPVTVSGLDESETESADSGAADADSDSAEETSADTPPSGESGETAEPDDRPAPTVDEPEDEPADAPTTEAESNGEDESASAGDDTRDADETADTETDLAPSGSGWAAQVGSFTHRDNADDLIRQLRDQGFEAFLMRHRADGRTFYRVRVGLEPDREGAVDLADRIRRETGHEAAPVPHP